ncbi:hypothetical protein SBA6_990027 [Candidatus Sulfopaludibacter sp. SbA6]|nr:hypothetical protein SBA6_990027 [Candidatus Sulfopaludibacter sp. SbA6]
MSVKALPLAAADDPAPVTVQWLAATLPDPLSPVQVAGRWPASFTRHSTLYSRLRARLQAWFP